MKAEMVLKAAFDGDKVTFFYPENEGLKGRLRGVLAQCARKNGGYALVSVQPPRRPRSTGEGSQNHHLNGHIAQIAEETGNSPEAVKTAVKFDAVGMGYPYKTIGGKIVPQSEGECSTEECAILIEAAHVLAADLRIILREAE